MVGKKYIHVKHGKGKVVADKQGVCKKGEVLFYAEEGFPSLNYSEQPFIETTYVKTDIVFIKDLKETK